MTRTLRTLLAVALALAAFAASASAASAAPTVTTGPATAITQTSATLNGFVSDHGKAATYFFDYGTSKSYGARTPVPAGTIAANAGTAPVAAGASGLAADTTYHFRIVATTSSGTSKGADRTFKTQPIPTTSTINVLPNPMAFGGVLTVYGSLVGPADTSGKSVALQANPFPYTGGFKQVGNTQITDAHGGYVFPLAPPAFVLAVNSQLRVVDLSMPSVVSPVVTEQVAVTAVLKEKKQHTSGRDSARHISVVRFTGSFAPAHDGTTVLIQRKLHGTTWQTVASTRARHAAAGSNYIRSVRLRKLGRFRAVVTITTGDNLPASSNSVVIH